MNLRFQRIYLLSVLTFSMFFISINSSLFGQGLTFSQVGDSIKVEGTFKSGDAKRFLQFIDTKYYWEGVEKTVILDSPGGSLREGLIMGQIFREKSFTTLIKKEGRCYSACAIAFLGGTKQYMTGSDISRNLEIGAELGFHGYSYGNKEVVLLDEAFDVARAINGLIIQYASDMRQIDLNLLSDLLAVDPDNIRLINTPRQIQGLGIDIKGDMSNLPNSWALTACTYRVEQMTPVNNPITRISNSSRKTSIKDKEQLEKLLMNDLYPPDDPAHEALEMLTTNDFFSSIIRISTSIFPAWRINLSRGAGFYYDYCYAVRTKSNIYTIIVNKLGGDYPNVQNHTILAGYPQNIPLW